MRIITLLLTLTAFSAASQPINTDRLDECKAFAATAKEIMQKRQTNRDLFQTLELYPDDSSLVLEAYEEPFHDILSQLMISIESVDKPSGPDERRKYDEVNTLRKNAIAQFEIKHLKACLKAK